MPQALRSAEHLRGLPALSAKDGAKVSLSNRLADRAGQLEALAFDCGVLGSYELVSLAVPLPGSVDLPAYGRPGRHGLLFVRCPLPS